MNFEKLDKEHYEELISYLKSLQDEKYRNFHSGLVKNSSSEIIGIRMPLLRSTAAKISKGDFIGFLENSGTKYYEEIILRGLVTARLGGGVEEQKAALDKFIPYIDNWAVCDTFCSEFKTVGKNQKLFFEQIKGYLSSSNPWAERVGLVFLMTYYLNDDYIDITLQLAKKVQSDEYYVKMAQAWLFSVAFVKYRDKTLEIIKNGLTDKTLLKMTVQKCVDSYRISRDDKELLKKLRPQKNKAQFD